jgi:hypothetical protein
LERAFQVESDYYFIADCDNFVLPHTLRALVEARKPIIAPMLHCVGDYQLSNFFIAGDYKQDPISNRMIMMKQKGITRVPLVHCTYLIDMRHPQAKHLTYISENETLLEYQVSRSAMRHLRGKRYLQCLLSLSKWINLWTIETFMGCSYTFGEQSKTNV